MIPSLFFRIFFFGSLLCLSVWSCQSDVSSAQASDSLHIRITEEPDRLNPMLSKLAVSSQIENMTFLPLADFNPVTLELEPVLLVSHPSETVIQTGKLQGSARYSMEILPEARWDNGTPVTGNDYEFTMRAALNPYLVNASWKSYISIIDSIIVHKENPKKIDVLVGEPYILNEEVLCGFPIYPEHIYDSIGLMRQVPFDILKNWGEVTAPEHQKILETFAELFNDPIYSRNIVESCGPYALLEWQSNQQIILEKKEDWWGRDLINKHPKLEAHFSKLIYHIIPDEQTAITSLKGGALDILPNISNEQFVQLQQYNVEFQAFNLASPSIPRYFYIGFNNEHTVLKDKMVRKALSHVFDKDQIIDDLFLGLATPVVGPVSPSKPYYANHLNPITLDIEKAKEILYTQGWVDLNGDRILDKNIEGEIESLRFTLLTTPSSLSQDLGLILKENALKAGIDIEILPMEFNLITQKIRNYDYHLATLSSTQSLGLYDPYGSWHSDNNTPTGNNFCHFSNPQCDSIIDLIRITMDKEKRNELYRSFQEIIYQEYPAYFLVSPTVNLAYSSQISMQPSIMRPGYFENTAQLK